LDSRVSEIFWQTSRLGNILEPLACGPAHLPGQQIIGNKLQSRVASRRSEIGDRHEADALGQPIACRCVPVQHPKSNSPCQIVSRRRVSRSALIVGQNIQSLLFSLISSR
jgi:hypothetical protein